MSEQGQVGGGGSRRYPRTFGGLVGSMVVLVVAVVGYWAVQNATHDSVDPSVNTVSDWRDRVAAVQTVATVPYPASLPDGWAVTSADWVTDDPKRPLWKLGVSTPDEQFVGLYLQDASLATLVAETVDEHADHDPDATIPTALGDTWSTWTDSDGDTGYATDLGKRTLIVYGTSEAELEQFMGLLTTDPIGGASRSAQPAQSS